MSDYAYEKNVQSWEKENQILSQIKELLKGTNLTIKTVHALWGAVWYEIRYRSWIPDRLYEIPFLAREYPDEYNRAFLEFGILHYPKRAGPIVFIREYLHGEPRYVPPEVRKIAKQIEEILEREIGKLEWHPIPYPHPLT